MKEFFFIVFIVILYLFIDTFFWESLALTVHVSIQWHCPVMIILTVRIIYSLHNIIVLNEFVICINGKWSSALNVLKKNDWTSL